MAGGSEHCAREHAGTSQGAGTSFTLGGAPGTHYSGLLCPQAFLTKVWWGQLCVDNGLWRVILCMLVFPLLYSNLISFR